MNEESKLIELFKKKYPEYNQELTSIGFKTAILDL